MNIKGFYHICLANEWVEIVIDQIGKIISSGLYEKSDEINIGCCGNSKGLAYLKDILKPYTKCKIVVYKEKIEVFEIPTLQFLQDLCQNSNAPAWTPNMDSSAGDFLVWYIHSKGAISGHKNWRVEMDELIINQHDTCIQLLEESADLGCCGPRLRCDGFHHNLVKCHFSGNFWWAKASYIKILNNNLTEVMNRHNCRFVAEALIGMSPHHNAMIDLATRKRGG